MNGWLLYIAAVINGSISMNQETGSADSVAPSSKEETGMSFGLVESKKYPTKTSLKAAMNEGNMILVFDASSNRGTIPIDQLKPTDRIIGPNVYDDRKWSANYKNGRIV